MHDFKKNVEQYKGYDPAGSKSIDEICRGLGWSKEKSYAFKYFISELGPDELGLLDQCATAVSHVIINAICIQRKEYKLRLLENIDRINSALSPFDEIEMLVSAMNGVDPLSTLANRYWVEVSEYLTARHIDQFPFTKKAIGFIRNIGSKGYDNLTRPQREWILGLLRNDKERGPGDRFFVNEHLIQRGYRPECETIEKYASCV